MNPLLMSDLSGAYWTLWYEGKGDEGQTLHCLPLKCLTKIQGVIAKGAKGMFFYEKGTHNPPTHCWNSDMPKWRRIVKGGHAGSKGEFQEEEDNKLTVTGCVWEINRLCFCSVSLQHLNQNKASMPGRVLGLFLLTSLDKSFSTQLVARRLYAAVIYTVIARSRTLHVHCFIVFTFTFKYDTIPLQSRAE